MKRFRFFLFCILVLGLAGLAFAPQGEAHRQYGRQHGMWQGPSGYDDGGWSYCPYCGGRFDDRNRYPMGHGYDPDPDYRGRGRYHMAPGYGRRGMGPGMMYREEDRYGRYPDDPRYRRYQEPLKSEEAKEQVERMLEQSRNPNLKVGDVEEKDDYFEIEIHTKGGDLVDRMQVDKQTGMMRSIY